MTKLEARVNGAVSMITKTAIEQEGRLSEEEIVALQILKGRCEQLLIMGGFVEEMDEYMKMIQKDLEA